MPEKLSEERKKRHEELLEQGFKLVQTNAHISQLQRIIGVATQEAKQKGRSDDSGLLKDLSYAIIHIPVDAVNLYNVYMKAEYKPKGK